MLNSSLDNSRMKRRRRVISLLFFFAFAGLLLFIHAAERSVIANTCEQIEQAKQQKYSAYDCADGGAFK